MDLIDRINMREVRKEAYKLALERKKISDFPSERFTELNIQISKLASKCPHSRHDYGSIDTVCKEKCPELGTLCCLNCAKLYNDGCPGDFKGECKSYYFEIGRRPIE